MRTHLTLALLLTALAAVSTGCQSGPTSTSSVTAVTDAGPSLDAASATAIDSPTATVEVYGMGCPLCANNVDSQLASVRGVKNATVDLGTGRITVTLEDSPRPSPADLAAAVDRAGFTLVRITTP